MDLHFAVDFDGTIALEDTTDVLLACRADPSWLAVEDEWLAGRIGSRECLARQAALVRATPAQLAALLDGITIDPDFAPFVAAAGRIGATMEIVSDGFDRLILPLLDRAGVELPVTCNRLRPAGADRWTAGFPAFSPDCRSMSGVCKCRAARTQRTLVLIGDGRSDFCLAARADMVLAKGRLAAHCAQAGHAFTPISSFADVMAWLAPFLAEPPCRPAPRPGTERP